MQEDTSFNTWLLSFTEQSIKDIFTRNPTFFNAINEKYELSADTLLKWHKELFLDTKQDIAGRFRDYFVKVGNYRAPDWQDINKLMKEFFEWYNKNKNVMHPVEFAARAHYKFEKIHPFGDGNGRIGRLIIAYLLRKSNFPLLIIEFKKRKSYYHALTKTEIDFMNWFFRSYVSAYKKYLK